MPRAHSTIFDSSVISSHQLFCWRKLEHLEKMMLNAN